MRVEGPNPLLTPAMLAALIAKEEASGKDVPFADPQAPHAPQQSPQTAGTSIPIPATSVAMLVALASDEPVERKRRAIAHAARGLDALERLRDQLAAGIIAPEQLHELVSWTKDFEVPDDPALAELARDIELRVRVELAKHDVSI